MNNIRNNYFDRATDVYVIDSLTRDLADYADEPYVNQYSIDYSQLGTIFEEVSSELENRYEDVIDGGLEALENKGMVKLLVD